MEPKQEPEQYTFDFHKETAEISAGSSDELKLKLGEFAGKYGYVMNGGTSAKALSVYEMQAKEFTGYWSGQEDLDTALKNTQAGMEKLLK